MRLRYVALLGGLALMMGLVPTVASPQPAGEGRFGYEPGAGVPLSSVVIANSVPGGRPAAPTARAAARSPSSDSSLEASDDVQVNAEGKRNPLERFGDGSGQPQNETSIAIDPTDPSHVLGAANDYETGLLGLYNSYDGGHTWPYSRFAHAVRTPSGEVLGSGDPAVTFDSEGVAYGAMIAFSFFTCDSYVAVTRSTNGGATWTEMVDQASEGTKLPLGDGIVAHNGGPDDCSIFHDKEYIAAGPRPAGAPLVPGTDRAHLSPDRLYVTWTVFDFGPQADTFIDAPIVVSYSDDQGRHWSNAQEISGSAPFCAVQTGDADGRACDESSASIPVVDQETGAVYVAFENFNTADPAAATQYLVTSSTDGGRTWSDPSRISELATSQPICQERETLDKMCARTDIRSGNIDVNSKSGDLYASWWDNRNGTASNTNGDVFVARSQDGGATWGRARNVTAASRDDQFFPWLSVSPRGRVAVTYFDRRYSNSGKLIDTSLSWSQPALSDLETRRVSDVSWNPDLAFRLGFFIGDYNGLDTTSSTAIPFWTDARFGEPNVVGNNPVRQQSDVMVDVEPLE